MIKNKAIIHIGGHKTGTSAIQAFCVLNKEHLMQTDILYPMDLVTFPERTGGQAHHCLVNLLMDAKTFWKSFNLRPKGLADENIIAALKALPRDKNILISSENLVWLDEQAIATLKELLDGFDVYVVYMLGAKTMLCRRCIRRWWLLSAKPRLLPIIPTKVLRFYSTITELPRDGKL